MSGTAHRDSGGRGSRLERANPGWVDGVNYRRLKPPACPPQSVDVRPVDGGPPGSRVATAARCFQAMFRAPLRSARIEVESAASAGEVALRTMVVPGGVPTAGAALRCVPGVDAHDNAAHFLCLVLQQAAQLRVRPGVQAPLRPAGAFALQTATQPEVTGLDTAPLAAPAKAVPRGYSGSAQAEVHAYSGTVLSGGGRVGQFGDVRMMPCVLRMHNAREGAALPLSPEPDSPRAA